MPDLKAGGTVASHVLVRQFVPADRGSVAGDGDPEVGQGGPRIAPPEKHAEIAIALERVKGDREVGRQQGRVLGKVDFKPHCQLPQYERRKCWDVAKVGYLTLSFVFRARAEPDHAQRQCEHKPRGHNGAVRVLPCHGTGCSTPLERHHDCRGKRDASKRIMKG